MTAKKYVAYLVGILALIMLANLALWHGYVKEMFTRGELSRLGSFRINETLTPHKKFPASHSELSDYLKSGRKESFDIITIGDSFSNGCSENYYQDILASEHDLKILNSDVLTDLYSLVQSELLDELNPRVVILESVGRSVQDRFGVKEILPESLSRAQAEKLALKVASQKKADAITAGIFPSVMFQANTNFFRDLLYRRSHPENLSFEVGLAKLTHELFTNKNQENLLLYYHDDLKYLSNPVNAAMINKNLNNVAEFLAKKNIKLIFMPCVDKYDLYYPYIKDKRGWPENNLFDELRKVPDKKYIFIDTKKILREALEHDDKDIYWLNDTHWSWRGMSIVCEKIFEALK